MIDLMRSSKGKVGLATICTAHMADADRLGLHLILIKNTPSYKGDHCLAVALVLAAHDGTCPFLTLVLAGKLRGMVTDGVRSV